MTKAAARALSAIISAFIAAGALVVRRIPQGVRSIRRKPKLALA